MKKATKGAEKRIRGEDVVGRNLFDELSDDLVISILRTVSASAKSPSDLIGVISSCKRMKELGKNPTVLRNASRGAISISAKAWCDPAHQFLSRCADAGNREASYILGMIEFYCLAHYARGAELLTLAAQDSHPEALYSLALIQFRGSGGNKSGPHCRRDPENAAALCATSAMLGHTDAITEVSYCFWSCANTPHPPEWVHSLCVGEEEIEEEDEVELDESGGQWWRLSDMTRKRESDGLELCSRLCGRRETRRNEFLRCLLCAEEFYCSHACQDMHWKMEHRCTCFVDMI